VLAANRKASATASTDAFDCLKAIADEGIIPFCEKALGFTPTDYQAKFLLDTKQFEAQCYCRQSRKDYSASSKLFWFAVLATKTTPYLQLNVPTRLGLTENDVGEKVRLNASGWLMFGSLVPVSIVRN